MDLVQKGGSATLDSLKQLMVKMTWSTSQDFDLAALYETKDAKKGMVYFGSKGDLSSFPFMKLSGDAGIGDSVDSGGNEEIMRITKLDDMKTVHIVVWDYGSIGSGSKARFAGSDVKVEVVDDKGNSNSVQLDAGETGNVVVLATIDNSSPIGAQLINTSKVGTLKGLSTDGPLWEVANS